MKPALLILIPLISALIGWFTNYLAVKMIFRPRRERTVLGIRIQGLIPKRKRDLARKIGETVERELISHRDIHEAVNTPGFHEEILDAVMVRIERFMQETLGANPLVAMFLSGETALVLKSKLQEALRRQLPGIIESLFEKVEQKLDFKKIITEKVDNFDLRHLESIVYAIAARELKAIEYLGGLIGFIVGLCQVALFLAGSPAG